LDREQPGRNRDRAAVAELRPAAPNEERAATLGRNPGTTAPEHDAPGIAPGLRVEFTGGAEYDERRPGIELMQPLRCLSPGIVRRQAGVGGPATSSRDQRDTRSGGDGG